MCKSVLHPGYSGRRLIGNLNILALIRGANHGTTVPCIYCYFIVFDILKLSHSTLSLFHRKCYIIKRHSQNYLLMLSQSKLLPWSLHIQKTFSVEAAPVLKTHTSILFCCVLIDVKLLFSLYVLL